jgi:hypothetical protein
MDKFRKPSNSVTEELVCELVRELQFSRCELSLLEAGSWGTGIFREPRGRGTSAIESRYRATTGEDTADWKYLMRAVVNCRACELPSVDTHTRFWLRVSRLSISDRGCDYRSWFLFLNIKLMTLARTVYQLLWRQWFTSEWINRITSMLN